MSHNCTLSPPGSAPMQASHSNPPVEEGDQVLYINGKSTTEKTHEQIINMITSSG